MLKTLLKYDLRSVFKYWWLVAASSLALCVAGGGCITVLRSERDIPQIVEASVILLLVFAVIGIVAFALFCTIILFVRFYKNFFTDEGYLTFTLPVKCSQLLNSKLLTTLYMAFATVFGIGFNTLVMLAIGFYDKFFNIKYWRIFFDVIREIWQQLKGYTVVYLIELLVLAVLTVLFSFMFLYCCITLASIITKKARVITSIGIYYGANMIFTFCVEIFTIFGMRSIEQRMADLSPTMENFAVAMLLLTVIGFMTLLCLLIYTLQYWMLDRRLNLA